MSNTNKLSLLLTGSFLLLATLFLEGCNGKDRAFQKSHDSIRIGMTLREVFDAGLADYLIRMRNKNVPGGTLPNKQPISETCKRYVVDIYYFEPEFWVRVYCGMNEPSSPQVIPQRSFKNKQEFLQALDTIYAPWIRSLEFRVESPPKQLFGVYDHYKFTIDEAGSVITVSPVIFSP